MVPRRLASFSAVFVLLFALPLGAAAQPATPPGRVPNNGESTLTYREISAFTVSPNSDGEQAPILSDNGERLAFAVAPGTGPRHAKSHLAHERRRKRSAGGGFLCLPLLLRLVHRSERRRRRGGLD